MLIRLNKDESTGSSYTTEQLNAAFASPLFTGCEENAPTKLHLPGPVKVRDHQYWLPLIALFSGARLGELGQLTVDDVREEQGRWIMHITREGGKTTKTKGSQRVVPIHHELIRLGFLDYHTERSKAADKRLFPRTKTNSRGQVAADFSRQWGKYLTEIGVKAGPGVNFHSFRHTFTDALRRAGFLDEQFGFILGHSKATTTGRYGILTEGQLEARVKLIDSVSYEGLDVGGNSNNASGAAS